MHLVVEANRQHPLRIARMLCQCAGIILKERPDVVLSAGAAPGCLMSLLGKLTGAKVVWLDSIANVERPSLSGRIARRFADLFLVQWPHLAKMYSDAEFLGEVV